MEETISENEKEFDKQLEQTQEIQVVKRKGKPKSEEWKQKHSEAMKQAHAKKKQII